MLNRHFDHEMLPTLLNSYPGSYKMNGSEKHVLLSIFIKEINIYENKQPNGQWLKQIVFSLPIIGDSEI